jgi:two-component system copper resistance phosphate regulon response regulator CusR
MLIVEDEPRTGDYLRQRLREAGFTVDLAHAGSDALPAA